MPAWRTQPGLYRIVRIAVVYPKRYAIVVGGGGGILDLAFCTPLLCRSLLLLATRAEGAMRLRTYCARSLLDFVCPMPFMVRVILEQKDISTT